MLGRAAVLHPAARVRSCYQRMMLPDDCSPPGRIDASPSGVIGVRITASSAKPVPQVSEDEHDIKIALPIVFLLLQMGGLGEVGLRSTSTVRVLVFFNPPMCRVLLAAGIPQGGSEVG